MLSSAPITTRKESTVDQLGDIEIEESECAEEALVHEWRAEQLARLGLPSLIANAFAGFVDWHEVAHLVQHGCTPELALEIVR
jgi:hypothetical protein